MILKYGWKILLFVPALSLWQAGKILYAEMVVIEKFVFNRGNFIIHLPTTFVLPKYSLITFMTELKGLIRFLENYDDFIFVPLDFNMF